MSPVGNGIGYVLARQGHAEANYHFSSRIAELDHLRPNRLEISIQLYFGQGEK